MQVLDIVGDCPTMKLFERIRNEQQPEEAFIMVTVWPVTALIIHWVSIYNLRFEAGFLLPHEILVELLLLSTSDHSLNRIYFHVPFTSVQQTAVVGEQAHSTY